MQKTKFEYEILINDDASTDNTPSILNEFEKYNNITILYQKNNLYSKGLKPFTHALLPLAKGKYIAICEGDDYWTDTYKLQKQVDFLENNLDYSFTIHSRNILINGKLIFDQAINHSIFYQCFVFRKFVFDDFFKDSLDKIIYGDAFLYYKLLSLGKCKILDFNGAVYRIHENGIHSGIDRLKAIEKNLEALIKIKKYHKTLNNKENIKLLNIEIAKSYIVLLRNNLKKLKIIKFFKVFLQSFSNISIFNYIGIVKKKLQKIEQ
jgi:hypothetical protein